MKVLFLLIWAFWSIIPNNGELINSQPGVEMSKPRIRKLVLIGTDQPIFRQINQKMLLWNAWKVICNSMNNKSSLPILF